MLSQVSTKWQVFIVFMAGFGVFEVFEKVIEIIDHLSK